MVAFDWQQVELSDWMKQWKNRLHEMKRKKISDIFHQHPIGNDYLSDHRELSFNIFEQLPEEIVIVILSFLSPRDLASIDQTCRKFHLLARDDFLWYQLSQIHFQVNSNRHQTNWRRYFAMKWTLHQKHSMNWLETSKSLSKNMLERSRHSGNVFENQIIFIGGNDATGDPMKDVTFFDPSRLVFKKVQVKGDMPYIGRHSSCMIDNKIWIFGGSIILRLGETKQKHNELAVFDPPTCTWHWVPVQGEKPPPRSDHACCNIGKKIYIFGGSDVNVQPLNDIWEFDTETMVWRDLTHYSHGESPYARSGHSMVAIGNRIFVYGGAVWSFEQRWQNHSNEMFIYDVDTLTWTKPAIRGPQPSVSTFTFLQTVGPTIWIFGGGSKYHPVVLSEIRVLDTINMRWSAITCTPRSLRKLELITELKSRNIPFYPTETEDDLCAKLEHALLSERDQLDIHGPTFKPRGCLAGGIVNNKLFLFGGFCGAPLNELKILDLSWKTTLQRSGLLIHSTI